MSHSLIKNIIIGTIPGLIIAAAGFYVFTAKPQNPLEGLSIRFQEQLLPVNIFGGLAKSVAVTQDSKPADIVDKFFDYFSSYRNVVVRTYDINNIGGTEIKNLGIFLKSVTAAYIEGDEGARAVPSDVKNSPINLLPSSAAKLSVMYTGARYEEPVKFVLNGQAVPVKELNATEYRDPLSEWTTKYPGIAFFVWSLAGIVLAMASMTGLIRLYLRGRPHLWAQNVESQKLVDALTAINYLRTENPAKFDDIVARSSRLYKHWEKQRDHSAEG